MIFKKRDQNRSITVRKSPKNSQSLSRVVIPIRAFCSLIALISSSSSSSSRGLLLIVSFIYRCVTSHREKAKSWSFSLYRLKLYFQFSILTSDKATRRSGKGTITHFMYSLHSGGWCCGFHDLVRLSVFSIAEWGVREIR